MKGSLRSLMAIKAFITSQMAMLKAAMRFHSLEYSGNEAKGYWMGIHHRSQPQLRNLYRQRGYR